MPFSCTRPLNVTTAYWAPQRDLVDSSSVFDGVTLKYKKGEQVEKKDDSTEHMTDFDWFDNVPIPLVEDYFQSLSFLVSQQTLYYSLLNLAIEPGTTEFLFQFARGKKIKKKQSQARRTKTRTSYCSPGWAREHYTHLFISISHQIRSLADKSTSWHITSSLRRKLTRDGNPTRRWRRGWRNWTFFWQS